MRRTERGEGQISTFFWLAMLAAVIYAGWHVGPVYMAHYNFADKVQILARSPRGATADSKILDLVMKAADEEGVTTLGRNDCTIKTTEAARRIHCEYERTTSALPGWKKTFHFVVDVDQPMVF